MKKIFFLLGILLLNFYKGRSQEGGLKLGQKVPDIYLGQFLNDPQRQMKFADFKGKLLVLDFWGVDCKVCISDMPKIDSMQKRFGSKIQFICVTRDSENQVNTLFSKIKIKRPGLPFIVGDKNLQKLFPHSGVPFHVWITPNGYVYALTDSYNTNEETLSSYFEGKEPQLPRRWDWGFNRTFPIVSEQNSSLLNYADSYSVWLRAAGNNINACGCSVQKDKLTGRINFLQLTNADFFRLYDIAYMDDLFQVPLDYLNIPHSNRIILEVGDSSAFFPPQDDSKRQAWLDHYQFSCELKLPQGSNMTIADKLKQELVSQFPYNAQVEKRTVTCLVLSDLSLKDQQKAVSPDSGLEQRIIYNKDRSLTIQNLPINDFIKALITAEPYSPIPFYSETSFSGNLQMHLNARFTQVESLNKELNKYGFKITREVRSLNMLVIRDKKVSQPLTRL